MTAGDIAWVLASAALVLFMTPGLAFFYGGMDRSRNVLNMLMMNFWCLLAVPIVWVIVGFSLAYSGDGKFIGNLDWKFLDGMTITGEDGGKTLLAVIFLGMFAVHHPGAHLGRRRRPHEVLARGRSSSRCGSCSSTAPCPSGSTAACGARASPAGSALEVRSTSPAARSSTSTPASPRSPPSWCSASARAGRRKATRRTRCRSSCWAPASCGSAGSASTPARPSPPTAPPSRRS